MSGRVWRWVGGGIALGLLPLVVAYLFSYYRAERPPALKDLLGAGQAILVAVMWAAGALREARDAPQRLKAHRDFVQIAATIFLFLGATGYGFITGDTMAGRAQTEHQREMVTVASVVLLALAASISTYAAAINTREDT
jgi:hypothetical protein